MKIAISGKARSGKDTSARMIKKFLNDKFFTVSKFAFADDIKVIAKILFPILTEDQLYGDSVNRDFTVCKDTTIRKLAQEIGKFGRNFDENIWAKNTLYKVKTSKAFCKIISDLRFVNEYNLLKENDFKLIRIKRDIDYGLSKEQYKDISEVDQDNLLDEQFDLVINNNGSVHDLEAKLKHFIGGLILSENVNDLILAEDD